MLQTEQATLTAFRTQNRWIDRDLSRIDPTRYNPIIFSHSTAFGWAYLAYRIKGSPLLSERNIQILNDRLLTEPSDGIELEKT